MLLNLNPVFKSDVVYDTHFSCVIGSACTDPGTPPGAEQVPCPEGETLSYEAGSCISYKCRRSGYMYTGPDLSCDVGEGSVAWSANPGSCEGKVQSLLSLCAFVRTAWPFYI